MSTSDASEHFRRLVRQHKPEQALHGLINFLGEMALNTAFSGSAFPFPALDDICAEIGAGSAHELLGAPMTLLNEPHDIVLVTETFVQGGHAQIINDLADLGERKLLLIATNLYNRKSAILAELATHKRVAGVLVLEGDAMMDRLRAAQTAIANPAAKRVMVLCHAHDAVAIAAAAPVADKPVLFFHHCDHTPCLGNFMRHAVHVDLHNLAHAQCRVQLGIEPGYLCLTSRRGKLSRAQGQCAVPSFKSATCGNEHKLVRLRYPITYRDVVQHLVAGHKGTHFHIGDLSAAFVEAIRDGLEEAGLSRDAFIHVGHVPAFREIVEALEIDLYIPTLPQSGGKALIDAMSAGCPILVHENAIDRLWGGRDLVYASAPSWASLDEFDDKVRQFSDRTYWHDQATASRAYFEEHHANTLFARMLQANGMLADTPPPALKPYRPGLELRLRAHAMAHDMTSQ